MIPVKPPENNDPEKEDHGKNKKESKKVKEKGKKEISIYTKEKNKDSHNSSKNLKIQKNKSLKSANKNKCRKSNSVAQGTKPQRKKTIQDELKKINEFKKILTKNSKIYAKKYGEEILKRIISINDSNNVSLYNSIKKTKKVDQNMINKKTTIINSAFKKLINCSQKNINVNIVNSFKIINEKDKRRNSYDKENLSNYLKRFEFTKEKGKNKDNDKDNTITNKRTTIDKTENNIKSSIVRYHSFTKSKKNSKDKSSFQNKKVPKINYSLKSFKPDSIKQFHNISFNFIPIMNIRNSDKKEETNKIVFYSILLNDLYNKYISQNSIFKTSDELEEEKKRFLYQLYYCLGLTKIFILNFKENKIPSLASESILTLNNKKHNKTNREMNNKKASTFSENSGIKFKTFYETFSNYSQIKLSSLEKFDNKSYPNIEIVNNYYIFKDKQIGKGGSSVVYLGEDDENHKTYAIKVTDKNLKANPFKHIYDYVKEEVSILKRIHSKYIVTTYEIIESKSRIYIIMEYMSLGPVNKMIDRIDENQIKQYTRNLICAVEHCHKIANIIHKDINVNNLLVNKEGIAKLCDFGISSVFVEDNDLLPSKGPSTYTPPEKKYNEQYRGKPADIYLIGLTLFHMVYKRPLFKDFGNLTKKDYINIDIPKKDDNNKEINSDLYDLIQSMLSFNPNDRPTINKLKRDPWLTDQMKNPFPDVIKEALFYSLELTRKQIESLKNDESIDDEIKNIKQKNKVEEEETEEEETEEEEEEEEESIEEKDEK